MIQIAAEKAPLIADYSYVSAVANCPRYGYYAFERGLTSPYPSLALHLGSAIHIGLDWLYTHDWDIEGAIAAALTAWGDFSVPETNKHSYATHGHLECILRNYADDRRFDPVAPIRLRPEDLNQDRLADASFSVDAEGFVKLIESPLSVRFGDLIYGGKIDLPNMTSGEYSLWDNKSSRSWISEHWAQKYAYSHQMRGYLMLLRELTSLPFDRIYINGIYTGKEASDEDTKWTKRTTKRSGLFGPFIYSDQHLAETRSWARRWLKLVDIFRADALLDGEDAWPQNDKSCFQYGEPCTYYALCKTSPHIRESIIKSSYVKRSFTGVLASGADSED